MAIMRRTVPILCIPGVLLTSLAWTIAGAASPSPSPAPSNPHDAQPNDVLFASPTRLDHIGHIVAPVTINGKGPFRFIIDTGASHSTIAPATVEALGLAPSDESSMEVNGITGAAVVPSVSIRKLQAGDLVIENAQFPILWAPLMGGADGILGVAGFRNASIFVDFVNNQVVVSRSRSVSAPNGATTIPARVVRGGLMSVAARIGGTRVDAIIDTGSERTIGNMALYHALYKRPKPGATPLITHVYGATTEVGSGEVDVAPTIELSAAVKISSVTVVYGDFHIFGVWGMLDRPAVIIGMDVLGTVRSLGIDFRRSELYFDSVYRYESAAYTGPACQLVIVPAVGVCAG
jgi:predicted aspartyl protease